MLGTLSTLLRGASARSEDHLRDFFALDLIDQKIRETEDAQAAAKTTLAMQIQRLHAETSHLEALEARIKDIGGRIKAAMKAGEQDLAAEAAQALADLENERDVRFTTTRQLETHVEKLRASVDKSQRRLVDLKHGAMQARAVRQTQILGARKANVPPRTSAQEAQALIDRVMAQDNPEELAEICEEVEAGVTHATIEDRLAAKGFGSGKTTAADILARFE